MVLLYLHLLPTPPYHAIVSIVNIHCVVLTAVPCRAASELGWDWVFLVIACLPVISVPHILESALPGGSY